VSRGYHPHCGGRHDSSKDRSPSLGKKKNKRNNRGSLVVAADRKGGKAAAGETPDHFERMLEKSCPDHAFHVKHMYKDYALMKKYLSRGSKKGEQKKKPEPTEGNAEGKDDGFPDSNGCLMIFGRPKAFESKRCQKLTRQEVYLAEPAMPSFLWWSLPLKNSWSSGRKPWRRHPTPSGTPDPLSPRRASKRSSMIRTTQGTRGCGSAQRSPQNRKVRSSTTSVPIKMSLRGSPRICRAYREKSPSTP
jgi:hypothetical protein